MIYLLLALLLIACSPATNPISKEYPCGTRAHACSTKPLTCCWNFEECDRGMCRSSPEFGQRLNKTWTK